MKPDLQKLLDQLQNELRLRDWRVEVSYVPNLAAADGRPVYGLCSSLVDGKMARIEIRDPSTPLTASDPSVEEILIHELVHLHFAPFATERPAEIAAEEQAVWALSEAIHTAKDASRRAHIARAMVALTTRAAGRAAHRLATRRQEANMDLTMLLAALKAAVDSGDIEQVKALITQIEKASGAPDADDAGAAPPMAAAPPPVPPPEQPKQAAAAPEPAKELASQPAAPPRALALGPSTVITRAEFERYQVENILDRDGKHLDAPKRAFAMKLTPSGVREYLATQPPAAGTTTTTAAAAAATSTQAAPVRRMAPTLGAKRDKATDPNIHEVDRRMGLAPQVTQAISRDPRTGRLQISNIATGKVVKAAE